MSHVCGVDLGEIIVLSCVPEGSEKKIKHHRLLIFMKNTNGSKYIFHPPGPCWQCGVLVATAYETLLDIAPCRDVKIVLLIGCRTNPFTSGVEAALASMWITTSSSRRFSAPSAIDASQTLDSKRG